MKILFDHQIFSSQRFGGISRYHVQLMKYLNADWELPLFFSNNFYLKELSSVPSFLPGYDFRGKNRILERINRFKTVAAIKKGDFDIFHPTFYASYALPYLQKQPMVLTLHDMTHDRFQELPAARWEMKEKYMMAHAASAIIVPSRFTADELMALYAIPAEKIHVVYHGGPDWNPSVLPAAVDSNRFLFVGGRNYYKNFSVVLDALQLVPESTLLVAGPPLTPCEKKRVQDLKIADRIEVIHASDEELIQLYASCSALIFPSLMEGFGLPILESFAANCPVICSDIPVFHEIGGNAAIYFAPDSPEQLADAMRRNIKHRHTENIAEQLKKFSWKKCAEETYQVYQELLKIQ